ncbi:GntR family transcriptional regulator [Sphingosinicella sp. LHD-64]|uniref:GntR family transcriptional regulator n=1 Tax=Sphingosinicella sp. LHD-64 TaxID=3072139 RepID=UPI00280EBC51|nr:GntR family transcriptional regulator [Sphingosinicella sp. LHD-64]MDQ8757459.1 GntR family transcriptional regulator [Sphingosinicella sp. LHD-64]
MSNGSVPGGAFADDGHLPGRKGAMSPGATFERVYRALKGRLADGRLGPGARIEPAILGTQLHASITPVRDALHRLVGERLVEAPEHDGFRVPLLTEAALRSLYEWNGLLLALAAGRLRPGTSDDPIEARAEHEIAMADLFLRIANATGNAEHAQAVASLNHRLAPYRRVEPRLLADLGREHGEIDAALDDRARLRRALVRYHRRRIGRVPEILAMIQTRR